MKDSNQLYNTPSEEVTTASRSQGIYDILLTVVFLVLVGLVSWRLAFLNFYVARILWLDLVILAFAIFRLTKLVISDGIFQWFRDLFLVVRTEKHEQGFTIHRSLPARGLRREVALLLDCPWCVSLWVSLLAVYIWFVCPLSHLFFLIMALGGVGTLVYIGVKNMQSSLEMRMK